MAGWAQWAGVGLVVAGLVWWLGWLGCLVAGPLLVLVGAAGKVSGGKSSGVS